MQLMLTESNGIDRKGIGFLPLIAPLYSPFEVYKFTFSFKFVSLNIKSDIKTLR